LIGLRGDRKAEKVVGADPKAVLGSGDKSGFQTSGRMVRVMMFQSSLTGTESPAGY
jgi:hypothetical protein